MVRVLLIWACAAILSLTVGTPVADARRKTAGIYSGVDLAKYFRRVRLPEYPYEARRLGLSGRGTYRAHVEASGKVTRVEVVQSAGHKALDDVVIAAALQWTAHPGKKLEVDFPLAFVAPGVPVPWQ
jgi:TonB family protein